MFVMPRHAPVLECSAEDKASLVKITKTATEEARKVERARIILSCMEGKEIKQVAQELGVSIPTVTKWRVRFSLFGIRGLNDQQRSGKPVTYDKTFRDRLLAMLEQPPLRTCRAGMGRSWQRGWIPACMRSGAFCARGHPPATLP